MDLINILKGAEDFIANVRRQYEDLQKQKIPVQKPIPKSVPKIKLGNSEDSETLLKFIYNLHSAQSMSTSESKNNIEDNVIKIFGTVGGVPYLGSGLLISENGYFITARHCVKGNKNELMAPQEIECRGIRYEFDQVCISSKSQDIALAKAKISKKGKEINFKINPEYEFKKNSPIVVISNKKNYEEIIGGYVEHSNTSYFVENFNMHSSHIMLNAKIEKGHSGSPVVSTNGDLVGIISAASINSTNSYCAKARSVLDLISQYAVRLREN